MKSVIAFALYLPFMIAVNASPVEQKSLGMKVALSKRGHLIDAGGNADIAALRNHVAHSVWKIQKGFRAYADNIGKPHPLQGHPDLPIKKGNPIISTTITSYLPVSTTFVDLDSAPTIKTKRGAGGSDVLLNEGVSLWHGEIAVGNPPQKFTVDFDTGSTDLFLPSIDCTSNCDGHQRYDPIQSSQSKSLSKNFKLAYADGSSVSGTQYQDTVTLAGLSATGQTLGLANVYSSGFSKDNFAPDGLLGMAFQSISDYKSPSVFETLVTQGQTFQPVFGFKLNQQGSELYIGGVNTALYKGDFTWTPVTEEGYWQVKFDAISNNSTQILDDMSAIIDTGTTLIIGDADAVDKFYSQIPGAQAAFDTVGKGMYTFPCSSVPSISFTFGGKAFPIAQDVFNAGTSTEEGRCVGSIVASDKMSFWIVGDVFLRGVYTAFDIGEKRVGFADLA